MAEEKYLARYEKSAEGNYLKASRGILEESASLAAAKTLSQEESGTTYFVSQAAAYTITLPAVKAGVCYKFVLTTAGSNDVKIDGGAANMVVGVIVDENSVEALDHNIVKFVSGSAVAGDFVTITCDGSKWYVQGACSADGGVAGAAS